MSVAVTQRFAAGGVIPASGLYLCVPCGYVERFAAGARFPPCPACLAGTEFGPEGWREGEDDFWEYLG